jgi:hypothetical protein
MFHKKIFCFDIDNTICKTSGNNYIKSKPINKSVRVVNLLYKKGHVIKLYTARYMSRNNDDAVKAKKQGFKLLTKQLKTWKINYHFLYMGKPSFDLLIDDKSIFFKKKWPEYLSKNFL